MKSIVRFLILFVLFASIGGIFVWKTGSKEPGTSQIPSENKPVLVNFSSDSCIYCKKMEPILEDLNEEYKEQITIRIVNVNEHPQEAKKNSIRVVPTQIFFNAEGVGIERYEGFMAKEDIIRVFEEMGVN